MVIASCPNTHDSATKSIYTPNYPAEYNINANCNWKIVSGSGGPLTLKFKDFDLEYNQDYLQIYDGPDNTASSSLLLTGNGNYDDYKSSGDSLFLQFTSNTQTISNNGFNITFAWEGNFT